MGIFSKRRDREPVDLDDRAPQTGVKFKDLIVLQGLVAAGADLKLPRHVLHYLYFPDRRSADAAAAECGGHSYETSVREPLPEYPDNWTVICERHGHTLSMDDVRDTTDYFEALSARLAGTYDGWEASAN